MTFGDCDAGWESNTVKTEEVGIGVWRTVGVGLQKFSAKTFSGEHNRLGQASILAEADSPVFFSRVVKVFLFLRKQNFVFSGFAFWPFLSFKKKSKRCWWLALLIPRTGFKSLRCLCLTNLVFRPLRFPLLLRCLALGFGDRWKRTSLKLSET